MARLAMRKAFKVHQRGGGADTWLDPGSAHQVMYIHLTVIALPCFHSLGVSLLGHRGLCHSCHGTWPEPLCSAGWLKASGLEPLEEYAFYCVGKME